MKNETVSPLTKAEVLEELAAYSTSELGFPSYLKQRLEQLTDFSLPNVDANSAVTPEDCLKFDTADTHVTVFLSKIENQDFIICKFTSDIDLFYYDKAVFDGIGICLPYHQFPAAIKTIGSQETPILTKVQDIIWGFDSVCRIVGEAIANGNATQGDKVIDNIKV